MTSSRGCTWQTAILVASMVLMPFWASAISVPTNLGSSANKQCTDGADKDGKKVERVYTLTCDEPEKDAKGNPTGKIGGLNCPCAMTTGTGGLIVAGHCVDREECRADAVVNPTDSSGAPVMQPVTNTPDAGAETSSEGYVQQTSGVTGGQQLENAYSTPQTPTQSGGAPSNPNTYYYSPTPASQGQSDSVQGIQNFGHGSQATQNSNAGSFGSGYVPAQTSVSSGGSWFSASELSNNASQLGYSNFMQFQIPQSVVESFGYYGSGYQTPQAGIASDQQQGTFYNSTPVPYNASTNDNQFYAVLFTAGNSVLNGIRGVYESLSGIAANSSADTTVRNELEKALVERLSNGSTPGSTDKIRAYSTETDLEIETGIASREIGSPTQAAVAVQDVRASLRDLKGKVEAISQTKTLASSTNPKTPTVPPENTASLEGATAARAAEATQALTKAEERVADLERELLLGEKKLDKSDARIQQLTEELNALNDRIKTVSSAISDPSLNEEQRFSLLFALTENVQLALTHAEARLQALVKESGEPETVGQVFLRSLGGGISGIINWTTLVSFSIAKAISSILQAIFASA